MVRKTSIDILNKIKAEGLLSARRLQVYEHLFFYGPMTAMEVFKALKVNTNQSGRFTELKKMGVISDMGEVECPVTGRTVTLWGVTNNLPDKLKARKTKAQIVGEQYEELRSSYNKLITYLAEVQGITPGKAGENFIQWAEGKQ